MSWNKHYALEGKHARFSPSNYHWNNYSDDKFIERYRNLKNAEEGTRKHALAKEMIELGIRPEKTHQTFNMYVNDAISYLMTPEVMLVYSINFFGTADAIDFDEANNTLRIFDLKNGVTPGSIHQLENYAALYCLEYKKDPYKIGYDLRLYELDDVTEFHTDPNVIAELMDLIKHFDKLLEEEQGV